MKGNTLSLLKKKQFLPLFITQFLGAFNDNIFKNALIMLIVFKLETHISLYTNIAAALFVLPFFIFSAMAGQLADTYEKSALIRKVKLLEVVIMSLACIGFYFDSVTFLIGILFLIGTQSAFFGPLKYSILPQHLKESELMSGNGLIEMGTFVAILLGTLVGAYYIVQAQGELIIAIMIVVLSLIGYLSSRYIPLAQPNSANNTPIDYNLIRSTRQIFSIIKGEASSVRQSIIAISWFWFIGTIYLTQMPQFVRSELGYSEEVVTLFLMIFSVGIGLGSVLCERMSKNYIEVGLIPFGALGLSIFGALFYFEVVSYSVTIKEGFLLGLSDFWNDPRAFGLMVYLCLIGMFGGFFTVPLYTFIQSKTRKENISRIISGNNIVNALFMVAASLISVVLLQYISVTSLFLLVAVCNLVVGIYICTRIPEFFFRFLTWFLLIFIYRLKSNGRENIPKDHGAVIVCNHVSFVDALLLVSEIKRPIRFIMYYKIYNLWFIKPLARALGAVPIAGVKEDPKVLKECFVTIKEALSAGELVCIFPEGIITHDGQLNEFKGGIERILKDSPVPVIPIALNGIYGSMFSRKHKIRLPRKLWGKVVIEIGKPVAPENATRHYLQQQVEELKKKPI